MPTSPVQNMMQNHFTLSRYKNVTICALVQGWPGLNVVSVVPLVTPFSTGPDHRVGVVLPVGNIGEGQCRHGCVGHRRQRRTVGKGYAPGNHAVDLRMGDGEGQAPDLGVLAHQQEAVLTGLPPSAAVYQPSNV